ncbi:hypothetical protein [Aequorivita echinoideorum]|uniref:Major capsid protein, N4-gp56 family n=1 Tax=Aequorivita echinoideorum TaxID=1549647 RepID=A0ABS5S2X0_9FLAO|nr:hypothetical protein [Aequorivita echinoideorum]MBT0607561.1 hypothetical protein [Aequorivita echinoideorum]
MARLKNDLLKLTGSLGGLTFSQDEKGTIVRLTPKVDEKKIKNSPKSQGTRDNMMEMGGASTAAKVLRLAFMTARKDLCDRYFSGRLSGAMRKVVAAGAGNRGKRELNLRQNGNLLEGFEFINARPLVYSVGGINEKPTLNADRNALRWTSPLLDRKKQITAAADSTHFCFLLGAATVPNYAYSETQKCYEPLEKPLRTPAVFTSSQPIALTQKTIAPLTLNLSLGIDGALPENIAVVMVVGVRFYKNVNGELLELPDTGGMRVLGVG